MHQIRCSRSFGGSLQRLSEGEQVEFLILGDFNAVADKQLDRSLNSSTSTFPKEFLLMRDQLQLIDVWRQQYQQRRDYTFFFSFQHSTYSRIDIILSSIGLSQRIIEPWIGLRTLSDHAPVYAKWMLGYTGPRYHQWHL